MARAKQGNGEAGALPPTVSTGHMLSAPLPSQRHLVGIVLAKNLSCVIFTICLTSRLGKTSIVL